ncbi:MAG: (deoxy)nucleoside triphosphate pyrophosphohydrolase [Candidatus Cloacimonetes bacterium]|nr:(deoxy)nucleoside triphosphate pyrophosphohydrolase [Candidatus Cloacimonadota bacterium]
MKKIEVVAAVLEDGDKILATKRGHGEFAGLWEFPGGKIEQNESQKEALRREIMEELDAEIEVGDFITTVEYDYPTFHLTMHCYFCINKNGILNLNEHADAIWLELDNLYSVEWIPADIGVVEKILEMKRVAYKK